MKLLPILLLLLLSCSIYGQTCNCPDTVFSDKQSKPIKVFTFENNKKVGVCGFSELKNKVRTYSEFVCFELGRKKIIDKWDATEECRIEKTGDTLYIEQYYYLPTGKNFAEIRTPFHVYKIFCSNNQIKEACSYKKDIPLYTTKQIQEVIRKFRHLKKENSELNLKVGYMLFWAFVSGSKEAEKCFKQMETKYGPFDGGVLEEWDLIYHTYVNYKSGSTSVKHIYFNEKHN